MAYKYFVKKGILEFEVGFRGESGAYREVNLTADKCEITFLFFEIVF